MSQTVHAHKILDMLDNEPMSPICLKQKVTDTFGADATFHTCKLKGLSIEAVFRFFEENQKIAVRQDGLWQLNRSEICRH